jgi:hypothetical protein
VLSPSLLTIVCVQTVRTRVWSEVSAGRIKADDCLRKAHQREEWLPRESTAGAVSVDGAWHSARPHCYLPTVEGTRRYVRRGEKAITLCRLGTVERTTTGDEGTEETHAATWFVYCPFWFVLAQTSSYLGMSKSLIADRRRAVIATAGPRSPSM